MLTPHDGVGQAPGPGSLAYSHPVSIRVVLAEDNYLLREGIRQLLETSDEIELLASCVDLPELEHAIEEHNPEVVITDIRMPPTGTDEGIQVAQALRASHPEVGVVVLSQFADPSYVLAILESGSSGRAYLLKERVNDPEQLISAIEAVVAGESVVDPKVVDVLVRSQAVAVRSPLSELTPRELEVLAQLAQGKSNAAIAESLVLSKRAVEKHINAIFMKLDLASPHDVSRRVMATLAFLAAGESGPHA
jgi:DNA-binding NarL/FixJ family response regulator